MKDDFTRRCEALDIIALALEGMRDVTEETIAASGLPTAQEREAVRCAARAARLAREAIGATIDEVNRACERLDADIRAASEVPQWVKDAGAAFRAGAATIDNAVLLKTDDLDEPGTTLREPPRLRTPGENLAEVLADMAREGR